jgi:hypothetical protein
MTISDLAGEFDKYMCPYCHGEGCDLCGFSGFEHVGDNDEGRDGSSEAA